MEPELGLGIVEEVVDGRVTIQFPAHEESRTYTVENAPLKRVRFSRLPSIHMTVSRIVMGDSDRFFTSAIIADASELMPRPTKIRLNTLASLDDTISRIRVEIIAPLMAKTGSKTGKETDTPT